MAGLIGVGNEYRQQALHGLNTTANLEHQRQQAGLQLQQANKQATMSAVGTGAGIGLMAGMQAGAVGGPLGMAIGAGVGLLASKLF